VEASGVIFVGDDWAEAHHDVYVCDGAGTLLAARRLPEGVAGIGVLHELLAAHATDPGEGVSASRPPHAVGHEVRSW